MHAAAVIIIIIIITLAGVSEVVKGDVQELVQEQKRTYKKVIFQLLVNLGPKLFLFQNIVKNDVLSDRKILQRCIDIDQ